jgi:hypothetical protein
MNTWISYWKWIVVTEGLQRSICHCYSPERKEQLSNMFLELQSLEQQVSH